jgi:N-dimethylarginine dimethylaminohydrolase
MTATPSETIPIYIDSEFAPLESVLMTLANPVSLRKFVEELPHALQNDRVRQQLFKNKWGPHNVEKVHQQQKELIKIFERHGTDVVMAETLPGSPCQHFSRDIGFCIDDTFFVSRMATVVREREQVSLAPWLSHFSKVVKLEDGTIEGGDVMLFDRYVLVGLGEATNPAGIEALRHRLRELNNPREVIQIEFAERGVVHLDCKFNIIGRGAEGQTVALISPKSITSYNLRWLEKHFDLIEATPEETKAVEINTVSVTPTTVVMQIRSERLAAQVADRGITPILIDYSEVTSQPGGLRCTTLPLARRSDQTLHKNPKSDV